VRAITVLLFCVIVGTCGEVVAPPVDDDFELPPADPSLDTTRLSVGDYIATPCGLRSGFPNLRNRDEWALVDIYFGRPEPEAQSGPSRDEMELVVAHGGRVLYGFQVPAVRARIKLLRIPALIEEGFWISVRDVPDAARFDVKVSVSVGHEITDDDIALFTRLGGRVTQRSVFGNYLAGIIPDRSIPSLRENAIYVQADGVRCLQ
jgi:hypothetical protein